MAGSQLTRHLEITTALGKMGWLERPPFACWKYAHQVLNFHWHLVISHQVAGFPQSAGLPLHDEHPQRPAGDCHQRVPCGAVAGRGPRLGDAVWPGMGRVERLQIRPRFLQRTAQAPERGGLLLDDFITQDLDGGIERLEGRHRWGLTCVLLAAPAKYSNAKYGNAYFGVPPAQSAARGGE